MRIIFQNNMVIAENRTKSRSDVSADTIVGAAVKPYSFLSLIIIFFFSILCRLGVGSNAAFYDIGQHCQQRHTSRTVAADLRCGFRFSYFVFEKSCKTSGNTSCRDDDSLRTY